MLENPENKWLAEFLELGYLDQSALVYGRNVCLAIQNGEIVVPENYPYEIFKNERELRMMTELIDRRFEELAHTDPAMLPRIERVQSEKERRASERWDRFS